MRKITKYLSAVLAALLALGMLAGCKSPEEAAVPDGVDVLAVGRYVESEVTLPLPEGVQNQMLLGLREENGVRTAFTCTGQGDEEDFRFLYYRHSFAADGTVTTTEEAWLNDLAPLGGNEMHVAASGGALYMCFSDYDENGRSVGHVLVSRDDGKTGVELTGSGLASLGTITNMGVLDDGKIAVGSFYDGSLFLLDAEGNTLAELESGSRGGISGSAAGGSYVAFAVNTNNLVRVYNATDGSYADYGFAFPENDSTQLAVSADGAVYLLNQTGLYRHAAGGALWEKLVEGATSTFGLPDFYASLLCLMDGGAYPIVYTSDLSRLLAYRYDETASAAADKEITVFSLRTSDTVRQAIVAFNRTRPDVKVSYTVAMEGASGGTEQDYIKALNTELLAGTGPDVLLLDGLPVDSYIEKDVLADLTETVAGGESILANIRLAPAQSGGLYAAPTGFTLPLAVTLGGTEATYESLASLSDAAESAQETKLLAKCAFNYKTLALYLLKYYGGSLTGGDAATVTAFLRDAKRLSEATGCTERMGDGWEALKDMPQDEMYEYFSDYIGSPQVFACASGFAQDILSHPLTSVRACMEPLAYAKMAGAALVSVNGQFVPTGVVGVNKASAEMEAASAFVQALLSYDAQGGNQYSAQFPVNERALAEMLSFEDLDSSSGFMLNDGGDFMAKWPEKAQRERLGALIATLDTPIVEDAALTGMLLPELTACLDGSSSVEQTAEKILSLLATYLSE